jgi:hypothetical protein
MKMWKITWYDGGLKEKTIVSSSLWNIASDLSNNGIQEWYVISIEQVAIAP